MLSAKTKLDGIGMFTLGDVDNAVRGSGKSRLQLNIKRAENRECGSLGAKKNHPVVSKALKLIHLPLEVPIRKIKTPRRVRPARSQKTTGEKKKRGERRASPRQGMEGRRNATMGGSKKKVVL